MKKILLFILFFLISISSVYASSTKYFCKGQTNQFFITFDKQNRIVVVDNNKPKKYWTEKGHNLWHSAIDYTVYEYTFKNSYNKLSGALNVKSHHIVTSEDKWYNYKCLFSH